MDPKAASALDPKLKEVYDRVMGTTTDAKTPPAAAPQPAAPTPVPPMPTPAQPAPMTPPPTPAAPATDGQPQPVNKSAIDYASLAAKYATPLPSMTPTDGSAPRPAAVKPSTTAYGVVNSGSATKETKAADKKSGGMKKILLLVGIPVFLILYTIVWVVVFGVDLTAFLPI